MNWPEQCEKAHQNICVKKRQIFLCTQYNSHMFLCTKYDSSGFGSSVLTEAKLLLRLLQKLKLGTGYRGTIFLCTSTKEYCECSLVLSTEESCQYEGIKLGLQGNLKG